MTGIKMVNGVKLSTGETVEAYYLDKEGYETLWKARHLDARIQGIWDRLEPALRAVIKIQEVLSEQLTQKCKDEMLEWLTKNSPEKSFKDWPFHVQFEPAGYGWDISRTAFEELIKEGKIDRRGKSGWYRLHREVQTP